MGYNSRQKSSNFIQKQQSYNFFKKVKNVDRTFFLSSTVYGSECSVRYNQRSPIPDLRNHLVDQVETYDL